MLVDHLERPRYKCVVHHAVDEIRDTSEGRFCSTREDPLAASRARLMFLHSHLKNDSAAQTASLLTSPRRSGCFRLVARRSSTFVFAHERPSAETIARLQLDSNGGKAIFKNNSCDNFFTVLSSLSRRNTTCEEGHVLQQSTAACLSTENMRSPIGRVGPSLSPSPSAVLAPSLGELKNPQQQEQQQSVFA